MVKVTFYSQAMNRKEFTACFRSLATAERFENRYKYFGGYNQFEMDIWGDTDEKYPIIPCSYDGFKFVYSVLF